MQTLELLGKQPALLFPGHPKKTPKDSSEKEPFHGNAGGKVPRRGGERRSCSDLERLDNAEAALLEWSTFPLHWEFSEEFCVIKGVS